VATRILNVSGDGFIPLFPLEYTAPFLAIYCSAVQQSQTNYFNFRTPVPRTFHGYVQLFDGQAVIKNIPIEYQSQLLWKNIDSTQLTFFRLCQLGDYIRALNTGLKTGFSATFNGFGVSLSASFPQGFDPYSGLLLSENPSSLAYSFEPSVISSITITTEPLPSLDCFTNVAPWEAPDSCGGTGTPPTQMPPNCLPVPPGGGGGS
jgi:hypothetical protein